MSVNENTYLVPTIEIYLKTKHQSLARIKTCSSYSSRRLNPNVPASSDSNVVVLVNFIVEDRATNCNQISINN